MPSGHSATRVPAWQSQQQVSSPLLFENLRWMLQSSHIICEAREEKRDSNLHCGGVEGLCVGEFLISERLQTRFSSAVSLKRCSVP